MYIHNIVYAYIYKTKIDWESLKKMVYLCTIVNDF